MNYLSLLTTPEVRLFLWHNTGEAWKKCSLPRGITETKALGKTAAARTPLHAAPPPRTRSINQNSGIASLSWKQQPRSSQAGRPRGLPQSLPTPAGLRSPRTTLPQARPLAKNWSREKNPPRDLPTLSLFLTQQRATSLGKARPGNHRGSQSRQPAEEPYRAGGVVGASPGSLTRREKGEHLPAAEACSW